MKRSLLVSSCILFFLIGCSGEESEFASIIESDDDIESVRSPLYINDNNVWTARVVPVCWESQGTVYDTEKIWVKEVLERTWQQESGTSFSGFSACSAGQAGIHVRFNNAGSATSPMGNLLNGVNATYTSPSVLTGVNLNTWQGTSCSSGWSRKECIETDAVHEFGHALSFAHEQNRPGYSFPSPTPSNCIIQGSNGNFEIGSHDTRSVMNYCNPIRMNRGVLSGTDVWGLQTFYGSHKPINVDRNGASPPQLFVRQGIFLWGNSWNGASWVWQSYASEFPGSLAAVPITSSPASVKFQGSTRVFARGFDGGLYQMVLENNSWTWYPHGGSFKGNPTPIAWGGNKLSVFVRSEDDTLNELRWDGGWSWIPHGGTLRSDPAVLESPGVISVFATMADGTLSQRYNVIGTPTWQWFPHGTYVQPGTGTTVRLASHPRAAITGTRIAVFVRGADGSLLQRFWDGSQWSWASQGGVIRGTPSAESALSVFVRGSDDTLYHNYWDSAQSKWIWAARGGSCTASPSAETADSYRRVFVRPASGGLHELYYSGGTWNWSTNAHLGVNPL